MVWFERLAASLVLARRGRRSSRSGARRGAARGEEAKQQVFTALRITNRALQQMNEQLAENENKKSR